MKLAQFKRNLNGAPIELSDAAVKFINAQTAFYEALKEVNVEIG